MTTKVAHPILRLEVVRPDGTRTFDHRVFCLYQGRSIATGTCCACVHCDAITGGENPAVVCTIPIEPEDIAPDPLGERTEVGAMLHHGTVALDPSSSLRDALALLQTEDRRSIAVVDEAHHLVGVLHEITFARSMRPTDDVAAAMSSGLAVHESTSVRGALRLLASAHLREAIVVDDTGAPLGVFRDVDGLRFITLAGRKLAG